MLKQIKVGNRFRRLQQENNTNGDNERKYFFSLSLSLMFFIMYFNSSSNKSSSVNFSLNNLFFFSFQELQIFNWMWFQSFFFLLLQNTCYILNFKFLFLNTLNNNNGDMSQHVLVHWLSFSHFCKNFYFYSKIKIFIMFV